MLQTEEDDLVPDGDHMPTPVTIERLRQELKNLKTEMDANRLGTTEYDQRLARIIQELRENSLDTDRSHLNALLDELGRDGTITPSVRAHLDKRLGLK
jgi:hypothetical protein